MFLSTLDKNHLSNLANLHHTISELLIGGGGRGWGWGWGSKGLNRWK
jgi:hypothetical protein